MTPLTLAITVCATAAALCWLVSVVTKNNSQVDRLWSLIPPVYVAIFAGAAGFRDPRLDIMAVLTLLWGARLTFNFARKGGYKAGGEDYRWPILRARMSPVVFHLFNFGFIAVYQNVLLLLITLPALIALEHPAPLGPLDAAATIAFVIFLAGETAADEQQWRFHQQKRRGETSEPFLTSGLFRFSRHPNFFCEQGMWCAVYAFSVAAAGWNVSAVGAVLLILLFQGSTTFTERISLSKYPTYAAYQRQVSRQLPLPPR